MTQTRKGQHLAVQKTEPGEFPKAQRGLIPPNSTDNHKWRITLRNKKNEVLIKGTSLSAGTE